MLKNYFKTALRNLARRKGHAAINIAGLVAGFAAFLVIFLVVNYENSYDDFHSNKKSVYRVIRAGRSGDNRDYRTGVPFPVSFALRTDFPQLKRVASFYSSPNEQISIPQAGLPGGRNFKEKRIFAADPEFFSMLDFKLTTGSFKSMGEPNTVLLTKEMAAKYFGDWQSAMGQTINMGRIGLKVTGILENPPSNTDFPLNIVVSYATLVEHANMDDWGGIDDSNYCFVQLDEKDSKASFTPFLDRFTDKHIKPVNPGYTLQLQPLNEIHFDGRLGTPTGKTFSKDLIFALSLIGIFLLVIACVNFINLTTAQAINRAREVGVRKVLGSNRSQLIFQFLGETGIITTLALIASVMVVIGALPFVNGLLDIKLTAFNLYNSSFIFFMLGALVAVTILSGFYPALVLSGFKSAIVLKSLVATGSGKGISLRRGLVVFQFVIAQVLIIGTLVVISQMNYFRNADMGFNRKAVINAAFPTDSLSRTKVDLLQNDLRKLKGVEALSFSLFTPTHADGWATDLDKPFTQSKSPAMIVQMKPADTSFFSLYDLKLVAGRIYFPSDTMREFVVNEKVVRSLGYKTPAEAVGQTVSVSGVKGPIVGVVKDFNVKSLREPIEAVVLTAFKNSYRLANLKIDPRESKAVIAGMQGIWKTHFPAFVFEYEFLDDSIANFYQQEEQLSQLYKIFAVLAIFISCLGLYGLIAFMAVQRRKEIGIRKILGAPVKDIVMMLSKEFTILIMIAFVIAAPIAWYYMHEWLQQYTFRIKMGWLYFGATIVCSLVIAWMTVGYTAVKAALANPVKALRTE